MTKPKGPRFRILHNPTGARAEVTAQNADRACFAMGWKLSDCMVLDLGSKIWLDEPKRYITPTPDPFQ